MKWFLIYQIYNYCLDSFDKSIREKFNHKKISHYEDLQLFLRSVKMIPNTRIISSTYTLDIAPDVKRVHLELHHDLTKFISGEMEKEMDKYALGIRDSEAKVISYDSIKQKYYCNA